LFDIVTHPELFEDEEVKAVQIMNHALSESNQSYTLLHIQCEFLRSKGKHEWALKLARQAVNSAPSEFVTWEMLTQVYIDLGEYESVGGPLNLWVFRKADSQQALLTLNSCPMFTYNGRDAHRQLQPARVHLPPKGTIVEILPERQKTEEDQVTSFMLSSELNTVDVDFRLILRCCDCLHLG
jgi:hypothetical protein